MWMMWLVWSITPLPDSPDDYVHRIGRTGRAGNKGMSISFISENDGFNLPAIEQYLDESIKMQQWSNDTRFLED